MGLFGSKPASDDGGLWGSLGDQGRVPGRGKHDANVIKTSKRDLAAKAKHAKAVKVNAAKVKAAKAAKAKGKK